MISNSATPRVREALDGEIKLAQAAFASLLHGFLATRPVTEEIYQRYLSMQYHLTRGVQEYFIRAAAHADLCKMRRLRQFLLEFANEEELHYLVAAKDLESMGLRLLPEPFDVTLWHAYFHQIVGLHPFIRLGAAVVLESISSGQARPAVKRAMAAPFLGPRNTKFLVLHQHEVTLHGDQLLAALSDAPLSETHIGDLVLGAKRGTVMYLRMAETALLADCPAARAAACDEPTIDETRRIKAFSLAELEDA